MAATPITCFLSGARIRTARGDIEIDRITPGDKVAVVRGGQTALEPVRWVGHGYVDIARHAQPEQVAPIRIRKDAIAEGQPSWDLLVSPEHCLIIDGLCVPAKLLVNNGSIVSDRGHAPFVYYHLELESHGVLLAENTPAESYLDTGNRACFDNAAQPRLLHSNFDVNATSARWVTDACAPLAKIPDQVEPIWRRLAERSVAIGYPIPAVTLVSDAKVHLIADGKAIQPVEDSQSTYRFIVPSNVATVVIASRFCIPSDRTIASQRDTRRLGVRVSRIAIHDRAGETIIAPDDPSLVDGWNEAERDGTELWRWTNGAARIPWKMSTAPVTVTLRCSQVDQYPIYDDKARLSA